MSWKKYMNQTPSEDGEYLTVSFYGKDNEIKSYSVHSWANNLRDHHSYDFDDEEYEHSGFYAHNPEWGDYEVSNVEAWMEIEEYIP